MRPNLTHAKIAGIALFAAVTFAITNSANAVVTFSDGTFTSGNWTITTIGNGTSSATQQTTGGNPTYWREVDDTMNDSGSFTSMDMLTSAVYDPSSLGAISSIDFSIDAKLVQNGQSVGIALQQSGNLWGAFVNNTSSSSWTSWSKTGLVTGNFTEFVGLSALDFSATAAPITFGFYVTNSNDMGVTTKGGFDNFSVTVSPVPEQSALSFIALGAVLTALVRSRRSPKRPSPST